MTAVRLALLMLVVSVAPVSAAAQNAEGSHDNQSRAARIVDLTLGQSTMVRLPGVSHVVVVDDSICRGEVNGGAIRLEGLARGKTVVVAWIDDTPESLLVRVEAPEPPARVDNSPSPQELDAMGHGTIGSLLHVGTNSLGARNLSMLTPFAWTQGTPGRRFTASGQVEGLQSTDASTYNLDTLSAQWSSDSVLVRMIDFVVDLDGGARARVTPATPLGGFAIRGLGATFHRGSSSYELFSGSTLPWFEGARQVAGLNVARQQTERVYIDATTAFVRVPVVSSLRAVDHPLSVFQTVGIADRMTEHAAVQARAGVGNTGFLAQGSTTWQTDRLSAFVMATGSSPRFGLNQLQLVYAPNASVQSGASWKVVRRLNAGVGYTHTSLQPTPLISARSQSDYASATMTFAFVPAHTLFANAVWDQNRGGLGTSGTMNGRRLDGGLSSQLGRHVANNLQLSFGGLSDPLQFNTSSEFTVRDSATVEVRGGSLNVTFSHDRLSPSLVSRLREQLNLLAPGLRPLFIDNPATFVQSPLLPPEIRQLLASLEPVDTQLVVSGHFGVVSHLTVSPTMSYLHHAQSTSLETHNRMIGYSLTWQLNPSFELQSTLANVLVFDPRRSDLVRSTVFGVGFRKTFNGAPRWVAAAAGYGIQGSVYRDLNMDGVADPGEAGISGVLVRLSDGRTARTDSRGRYEFKGLSGGEYRIQVPRDQLPPGVRLTTPIDQTLRLYERRNVTVEFGVVNFSRLIGTVFNDYALDGERRGDAPGLRGVEVVITGEGEERRIVTDAAGDFEIDDLPPGRYDVSVDTKSVPPNYVWSGSAIPVAVAPSSTSMVALPVRALRTVAGHVYARRADGPAVPLQGVQVVTQGASAITDSEGRFLLRDLSGGPLSVTLVPVMALPEGLQAPVGQLRMPNDPIQVDDAVIVIENPRLVPYLVTTPPAESR